MEEIDFSEAVTALADDEIRDTGEKLRIQDAIEKSQSILFDYLVQLHIKSAIKSNVCRIDAPVYLRESILCKIRSDMPKPADLTL